MRISTIRQSERGADAEVQLAVVDAEAEHRRTLRQLHRAADEPGQRRAREEDSARRVQSLDVEWRHLPRSSAEEHERTQRLDRRQRRVKCVLADAVISDIDTLTDGELLDLRSDVDSLTLEEYLVRARLAGELRLLLSAHRRNDIAAQMLDDLGAHQAD